MTRPARAPGRGRRGVGGERRGAVLPLVCLLLTVILGFAAIAIDLGRLYYLGAEAQAAADAAALAAARAMQLQSVSSSSVAPAAATSVAAANRAGGRTAMVSTVKPKLYSPTLGPTVAVPDAGSWAKANAVEVTITAPATYTFAKALGQTAPTLTRRATAWIANVDAATCVMPIVLPYTALYYLGFGDPQPRSAPDVTQAQLNQINAWTPSYKTIVLVPPDSSAVWWDNHGYNNYGSWMPADFTGAGNYNAYGDWVAGQSCTLARAEAKKPGVVTMPWSTNPGVGQSVMQQLAINMPRFCNFRTTTSANCWSGPSATVGGVRTRIVYGDYTVSTTTSGQPVTVRAVGEVKLMCYFRASTDVCSNQPGYPNGGWYSVNGNFTPTGYPPGTVIGVVEAPTSVNLDRTTVLGDIGSNVQRLVLVR